MNAQLAGVCRGNFPSLIPKTDQERVQNLKKEIASAQNDVFEVTEKMEGSSMTVYQMVVEGEMTFGVCSRNMDLKETQGNAFWDTARKDDIEAKMRAVDEFWSFAIQGELIGPGIQGNIYGLKEPKFVVFDVYDIQAGEYIPPDSRRELIENMGLNHVPVLNERYTLTQTVDEIIASAEGQSTFAKVEREGIVFKQAMGGFSFKAISNKYLLGEK
jgi:RNA ligase (TIGR02306 family)